MTQSLDIREFEPTIEKPEVERIWRKLKDTRLPKHPVVPDAGDDFGSPLEWVHKLHNKWLNEFDWDAAQKRINSWKHYTAELEQHRIHFIHEPGKKNTESAIPLLLVHGWPGTWFEFSRIIDLLTNPEGDQQAFHVAGDWGHFVVRELGAKYGTSCKAVHTNMCPAVPDVPREEWTDWENAAYSKIEWFLESHTEYGVEMRTRPQTIGIAIYDNPLGVLMWMGEKYHELADPKNHDLENKDFVDDLCTTFCLYLFTSPSIMTSALVYANNFPHEEYLDFTRSPENFIKVPFGFSCFQYDAAPVSQRAAATTGNCKWYKEYDHGGHFPALECAEELFGDLRDCFAQLLQVTPDA